MSVDLSDRRSRTTQCPARSSTYPAIRTRIRAFRVGAVLARLEVQILLRRLPSRKITLDEAPAVTAPRQILPCSGLGAWAASTTER
jgi:hypothetical protein